MTQPRRPGAVRTRAFLARSLLLAALAAVFALSGASAAFAQAPLICIDAGHGGPYSNANANRLREKNVNLSLARTLEGQLRAAGFRTMMTRTSDTMVTWGDIATWHWDAASGRWGWYTDGRMKSPDGTPVDDLQARVDKANAAGADVFISIHNNGARSRRARGTETWSFAGDDPGRALALQVQRAMIQQTRSRNRGAQQTGFYVLRWSNMPAVLVEGAFITNAYDARLLKKGSFRWKLCRGIVIGLQRWYGSNPMPPIMAHVGGETAESNALALSRAMWTTGADTVLMASNADLGAAWAAAPLARKLDAPLLLVDGPTPSPAVAAELARLAPDAIVALGPEASIDASAVASAAGIPRSAVRHISAATPGRAAALVSAEVGVPSTATIVVAGGPPAQLAIASAYAAGRGAPLFVTDGGVLPAEALSYLAAHSADITRTVVIGDLAAVTTTTVDGLPNQRRFSGADQYAVASALMDSLWPWATAGQLPLLVPASQPGTVLAAACATSRRPGPILLTNGALLSPFTRQWIVNHRGRVSQWVFVGGYGSQPVALEWMVNKASH